MIKTMNYTVQELDLNLKKVHAILGGNEQENAYTQSLARDLLDEIIDAEGLCGGYVFYDPAECIDKQHVRIEQVTFDVGKRAGGQLSGLGSAAVFVCTAGSEISNWTQDCLCNDALKGLIADVIASLITSEIAEKVRQQIARDVDKTGYNITNSYSPGYCDWSVSEQQKLFTLLPDGFCGVELNSNSLMIPIKSVSGLVGIGKSVTFQPFPCESCRRTDCAYRRVEGFH
ncbi:MAG: vitamin B12 dependent-methionine synthase activation domain-containing protein [candidate division KSB1 bacterium]|nr:vitamin B12 dependent-methionine synthase activation domain-containing protein [candidate division KSB1 bacterium]